MKLNEQHARLWGRTCDLGHEGAEVGQAVYVRREELTLPLYVDYECITGQLTTSVCTPEPMVHGTHAVPASK